jgi:hypothetical protein
MSLASDLRRLKELGWRDRLLLGETVAVLAAASFAIRLLPFRKVVGAVTQGRVAPNETADRGSHEIGRVRWAVEACARRLPWRIVCFQKGLALQSLLRRRGIPAALHYGVAQDPERGLSAHVWVTYGGRAIIGGDEAAGYTCLATFPPHRS